MEIILAKTPAIIQGISLILTIVTLLATVVVRLTPSKTDDQAVGKFTSTLMAVLHWLPTIGINPQTKKLEETIQELQTEKDPEVK